MGILADAQNYSAGVALNQRLGGLRFELDSLVTGVINVAGDYDNFRGQLQDVTDETVADGGLALAIAENKVKVDAMPTIHRAWFDQVIEGLGYTKV